MQLAFFFDDVLVVPRNHLSLFINLLNLIAIHIGAVTIVFIFLTYPELTICHCGNKVHIVC